MLPKRQRLNAREFAEVFSRGARYDHPLFFAKYISTKGAKFAAVVPVKVATTAVRRNRARRLCYGALRSKVPLQGITAVFFLKKSALTTTNDQMAAAFEAFFKTTVRS